MTTPTDSPQDRTSLVSRVNLGAIDAAAGRLLLHAGGVARQDGLAAVICGPSGSGKTTLTVRLCEIDLSYLTDEVVCLDPGTLRIFPYRKPAVLKAGSRPLFPHLEPSEPAAGPLLLPPTAFDKSVARDGPWSPGLLIFPTYVPGSGCDVRPVPEGEAAFLLGENSSRLRDVSTGALPALARLARRAGAYKVVHGDVDAAAHAVARLLEAA